MAVQQHSSIFMPRTITIGLSRSDRKAIETQIEQLIALLDTLDGDCDLEPDDLDECVDDYPLVEDWRPDGLTLPAPVWGIDQTTGPTNRREAEVAYRHQLLRRAA